MELHRLAQDVYFVRFCVALLLGVAIGLEREWRQRMAGLHTMAMVATGAAIFAMIAPLLDVKGVDPTRIAAQVVSGIGFLAGGVILRQGTNVRGLTTAATIWATSAVGVLVGFGFLSEASGATAVIVVANTVLFKVSRYVDSVKRDTGDVVTTYTLSIACQVAAEPAVREHIVELVGRTSLSLVSIDSRAASESGMLVNAQLSRSGRDDRSIERLCQELKGLPGVLSAQWRAAGEYVG